MMWMAGAQTAVLGCGTGRVFQNAALQTAYGGAVNPVTLGRSAVL